jgi:Flp pilus assembly pilin Flp
MISAFCGALRRVPQRCIPGRFRRFGRDENGAIAVEFAIVATPFIALMFAILETALVFFGGQLLESAISNSARLIRTGQAQQQGFTAEQFKDSVCSQVMSVFDCYGGLVLDVRKYATFDSVNLGMPLDEDGNLIVDEEYQPGKGGEIVVVRAFYKWTTFSRLLGLDLTNMSGGYRLLASTAAFKNEPFPW